MARAANQKLKCLYLWQFLLQNTDEEHPATIPQMIEYLAQHDIPAERKSLYDDIEALRQCGLDVEYRKAQGGGYYVASREFQLPELKLLVDAVQSSKFLSLRKSNALITKLEKLASRYEAQTLRRQVYVTHRVKNMNESIYYNVDALHSAIAAGSRITFRYFDWDITGKRNTGTKVSATRSVPGHSCGMTKITTSSATMPSMGNAATTGWIRWKPSPKPARNAWEKSSSPTLTPRNTPARSLACTAASLSRSPCNLPRIWPILSLTALAGIGSSPPPRQASPSPWRWCPVRSSSPGSPASAPRYRFSPLSRSPGSSRPTCGRSSRCTADPLTGFILTR